MTIFTVLRARKGIWILTLVCGGSTALAQQTLSSSSDVSGALDEVVVTAQKRSERLQDVPISIAELSADDLQRSGIATAADLPSTVSGLVWSNQGAWIEPNLRGVYTSVAAVGSQSPIAIYLDGVYQPMQAGTIADLPDVSRVEVLKGPQGTLFGRNATGGAISIYTLDPSFTPTGKFSLGAGSYGGDSSKTSGHYDGSAFFSGPLADDKLAGSISAFYDRTDGYLTDEVTGGRGGLISSGGARGKLLFKPTEAATFVLTVYYNHRDDHAAEAGFPDNGVTSASLHPPDIVPTQPWHFAYDGATPKADTRDQGASIKGTVDFDSGTLTSITGYTKTEVDVVNDAQAAYSPSCIALFACIAADVITSDYAWTQEFDFASKQMGPFRYVAGLFGFYSKPKENDAYNGADIDESTITNISYAGFAEGTYDLTNNLSGIVGVRVNHDILRATGSYFPATPIQYADANWTSTTPRVSLVYKFNSSLNTYFTYSQGFKAGVVSGQYTTAAAASPEKISAYELGLKAAQQNYSLNAAVFYYDYRDLQVENFNVATLSTVPQNAARSRIEGLDIDGAVKITDAFELRLDTTWLPTAKYTSFPDAVVYLPPLGAFGLVTDNTYNATGSRMLVTPRVTGTLSGTYTRALAAGKLTATASVYHSDNYRWEYTGQVSTGSYQLYNARVSFQPTASGFSYSLYGKNLANKAYIQGSLPTAFAPEAFYAPPREAGVKLDYSF